MANDQSKEVDPTKEADAAATKSDTSSSTSDSESEVEYVEPIPGPEVSDEEMEVFPSHKRAHLALFNWSCPNNYPKDLEQRRKRKHLKPEDLSKKEETDIMNSVARKRQLAAMLVHLITVDEPHKTFALTYACVCAIIQASVSDMVCSLGVHMKPIP